MWLVGISWWRRKPCISMYNGKKKRSREMEESNDSVTTKAKVFIARRSWFRCDIRLMSASLFHRADRTSMLMEFWMAFQVWCEFVIVMYASCCVEILLLHLWSESKLVQIACTVTFSALQKFTFQCKKEIIGFLMFLTWTFGNCRILGFISFWEPFLSIKKWAKIENKGKTSAYCYCWKIIMLSLTSRIIVPPCD